MKRQAILIGLFVLVALTLSAAALALVGGNRLFAQHTRVVVYFPNSVKGLYIGAPVTFRGVPIGQVEDIGIELDTKTLATHIPVRFFVTPTLLQTPRDSDGPKADIRELVNRGLRARLAIQSVVTGQAIVDLDFAPQTPMTLRGNQQSSLVEIPVAKGQFDDLVAQIGQLPLKDVVEQLRDTLTALNATANTTRKVMDSVGKEWGLTTQATRGLMAQTQQNLATVSTQAIQAMQSVQALTDTTRDLVKTTQPDIAQTLLATRQAAQSAQMSLQGLADLSAPGSPAREDLEATLRDLSQAARSVRSVSELVERQPNALIFGRK